MHMQWVERYSEFRCEGQVAPGFLYKSGSAGNLPAALENMIARAEDGEVLRIVSPVIEDEALVELLGAARSRGVIIKLVTALLDPRKGIVTRGWDDSEDLGKHQECIRALSGKGVLLRSTATVPHMKMMLLGNKCAYFGSANFASTSLRGNSVESGILIENTPHLEGISEIYEILWKSCCYRFLTRAGAHTLDECKGEAPTGKTGDEWKWGGGQTWFSYPEGAPVIASGLAEILCEAQSDIIFSALSLYDTDKIPFVHNELLRCLARGVRVTAVVRPEHFKLEQFPDKSTRSLMEQGLQVFGVTGLHAKGFLVDGVHCGMMSANFNPYSMNPEILKEGKPTANIEMAIAGRSDSELLSGFAAFLCHLVHGATHRLEL